MSIWGTHPTVSKELALRGLPTNPCNNCVYLFRLFLSNITYSRLDVDKCNRCNVDRSKFSEYKQRLKELNEKPPDA